MRRIIFALVGVVTIAVVLVLVLPHISRRSSGGMQAECLANAQAFAHCLKEYANDHDGALPSTLDQLSPDYLFDSKLRCPFHKAPSRPSYRYIAHTPLVVSEGQIILYCQGNHPGEVVSSDGDRSQGIIPAVLRDFSVIGIPIGQIPTDE